MPIGFISQAGAASSSSTTDRSHNRSAGQPGCASWEFRLTEHPDVKAVFEVGYLTGRMKYFLIEYLDARCKGSPTSRPQPMGFGANHNDRLALEP